MSDPPSAQSSESESQDLMAQDSPPPQTAAVKRPVWKRIVTPLILGGLGVVLLLLAIGEYPSVTTGLPYPGLPELEIYTRVPVASIEYTVTQVPPAKAELKITLLGTRAGRPVPQAQRSVTLYLVLPQGPELLFKTVPFRPVGVLTAIANFSMSARSSGVVFNGVTASAAIPTVLYHGTGKPALAATFYIPSASSYDWSSFSPVGTNNSSAAWWVQPVGSDTPGRVAIGIDYARQASDSNQTFIAGALLGLAGAAILSAVQEALHAIG